MTRSLDVLHREAEPPAPRPSLDERKAGRKAYLRASNAGEQLLGFARRAEAATAAFETEREELRATFAKDPGSPVFLAQMAEINERSEAVLVQLAEGHRSAESSFLKFAGRSTEARFPISPDRAVEAQFQVVYHGQLPLSVSAKLAGEMALRALDDPNDHHTRGLLQFLASLIKGRRDVGDPRYEELLSQLPIGQVDPVTEAQDRIAEAVTDDQQVQGIVAEEMVISVRPQVATVLQAISEEGRWKGSSAERIEGLGVDGEMIKNVTTPDLTPV